MLTRTQSDPLPQTSALLAPLSESSAPEANKQTWQIKPSFGDTLRKLPCKRGGENQKKNLHKYTKIEDGGTAPMVLTSGVEHLRRGTCRAGNGAASPQQGDDAGGAFWPNQRIFGANRGYFDQINECFSHIMDILAEPWIFWPEPRYFGPIPSMLAIPIAPSPHPPPQPPSSSLPDTGEAVAAPVAGGETEAPSSKAAES